MKALLFFTLSVYLTINFSNAYNLLLVFSVPVKSLSTLGEAFVRNLIDDGHSVTYITTHPMKHKPEKNYHEIEVSSLIDAIMGDFALLNITYLIENKDIINDQEEMMQLGVEVSKLTLEHPNVQRLLSDKSQTFDGVISELFMVELLSGFSMYYDCPMIWSFSMGVEWNVLQLVHEPTNPAYTTDFMSFNEPPLTFFERAQELWTQIRATWIRRHVMLPQESNVYKKVFGPLVEAQGRKLPPYEELIYNASLVFANTHHAAGRIPAIPQNFKLIGGYHITGPTKPLPDDLKSIMDNAKHGVIYFSMGSVWKSKTMPKSIKENLLKMFGELKQTVLWKYEEDLPNLPKNVHTLKWAPQQSILAHPNCRLFISHGGLLSSTEAIHFGVPTIGVPAFFDQFLNINKAVSKGYAIKVELSLDLAQDLKAAIETMINDKRFSEEVKKLSAIYHDRPASPGAELRHWVRHVIATRGAPHLRSPALLVPWYQKTFLDLVAVLLIILVIIISVLINACKIFSEMLKNHSRGARKKKN